LRTRLMIDGRKVELNEFTQRFLANILMGAVSSLKGVKPSWKRLQIELEMGPRG